jgi:uncharacterized CHY-type Zn-finger protein
MMDPFQFSVKFSQELRVSGGILARRTLEEAYAWCSAEPFPPESPSHKMKTVKIAEKTAKKAQAFSVLGIDVDWQNRCEHCTSPLDVVAFRYKCCGLYYACVRCHEILAGHEIVIWDKTDYETLGVLCGICRTEFTIGEYLAGDDRCPNCKTAFNREIKSSEVPMLFA